MSIPWRGRSIAWKVMIEDTLKKFSVSECSIKINLDDHPKKGHFNFCRPINNNKGYFIIPNFRFTHDSIIHDYKWLNDDCEGVKWEDTKSFIFENDTLPFEDKKNSFFFSGRPLYKIDNNEWGYDLDYLLSGYLNMHPNYVVIMRDLQISMKNRFFLIEKIFESKSPYNYFNQELINKLITIYKNNIL